ncbi:hypothetical protein SAMN05661091_4498 [Paenibacillus uliginis N3/975]|uniref:Uncharacterized protein n=1 Tax=Paenibacillus uliginis N3/975 TaxID=1313296 RepID=A0A1X7HNN7_9BACL|nr:ETEC_3214 domain-containing protein [Paenibacillus uliginis]SMF89049.1 hypothetical protein SAMN05661091_4498 [Paenibacillus uliginis N3/975]
MLKWLWLKKSKILNLVSIIIAILGVGLLQIFKPYIMDISFIRERTYEDKIEKIKVGYSRKYVEGLMGVPERENILRWTDSKANTYIITRTDYIKEDYLYSLYFKQDESLLGYGLVSKNKNFNPRLPFKGAPRLLKQQQDDYILNRGETRFTIFNIGGTRNDVSDFEMDFDYGHLFTGGLIVGYGVSELGYQHTDNVLFDYISNYLFKAPNVDSFYNSGTHYNLLGYYIRTFRQFTEDENKKGVIPDPQNEYRKSLSPNAVFVFDGHAMDEYESSVLDSFDTAFEFIIEQFRFGFLYTRIELFDEKLIYSDP